MKCRVPALLCLDEYRDQNGSDSNEVSKRGSSVNVQQQFVSEGANKED
jgi:hypothetical protein